MIQPLLLQIITMLIYALIGFALSRFHILSDRQSTGLSILCIYVAIPCAILEGFQQDYSPAVLKNISAEILIILLLHVVLLAIYFFILRRTLKFTPIEGVCMIYPNCGNMIIPLVTAMLGTNYVVYCCPFIAIQMIFLWVHGLSALTGEKKSDLKKIAANPCIIAAVAAFLLFVLNWRLPPLLHSICGSLGALTAPLSMVVAGVLLGEMKWEDVKAFHRLPRMILVRLVVIPLVMLVFVRFMRIATAGIVDPSLYMICFMSLTTPSASTIVQMAQIFTDDARYVSCINAVAMALCFVTIPSIMSLYFAW